MDVHTPTHGAIELALDMRLCMGVRTFRRSLRRFYSRRIATSPIRRRDARQPCTSLFNDIATTPTILFTLIIKESMIQLIYVVIDAFLASFDLNCDSAIAHEMILL